MMATNLGSAFVTIKPEMSGMSAALNKAFGSVNTNPSGAKMGSGLVGGIKASLGAGSAVLAGAVAGIASNATNAMMASIDSGIRRADIINNFPKVMSNFNISSKDAKESINKLSDSLQGLPTGLDAAAAGVQRLVSKNGDIDKSTDMFLALNDAVLAGGAPMDIQTYALEQLTQAYSKGKPDMVEWRSMMSAMPAQLNQTAEAMGFGASGANELGEALRNGDVSMDDFMDTIIRLDKEGSGGFQSFSDQAKNATGGIQTSIANVDNAMARFWQGILDAVGQNNIKGAFSSLSGGIDAAGKVISGAISSAMPPLKDFISYVKNNGKQTELLITAIASGFVAFKVGVPAVNGITSALQSFSAGAAGAKIASGTMSSALGEAKFMFSAARAEGQGFFSALKTGGQQFAASEGGARALSNAAGALKTGLIGVGIALAGIAIEQVISHFAKLKERQEDLKKASEDLTPILRDSGDALANTGSDAASAVGGFGDYNTGVDDVIKKHAELVQSIKDTFGEINADASLVEGYKKTIHDLAGQSDLTADKQADLQEAVQGVNDICGTNIQIIDGVNGVLSESIASIDLQTAAWINNAKAQSLQEELRGVYTQQRANTDALTEAQNRYNEAEKQALNLIEQGLNGWDSYANEMTEAQGEINRLTETEKALADQEQALKDQYVANAEALSSSVVALDSYVSSIDGLKPSLEEAGVNVSGFEEALSSLGFSTGDLARIGAEKFTEFATSWDGTATGATQRAIELGIALPGSVQDGIEEGKPEVTAAMEQLRTAGIEDPLSKIPGLAQMSTQEGIDAMNEVFVESQQRVNAAASLPLFASQSALAPMTGIFSATAGESVGLVAKNLGEAKGIYDGGKTVSDKSIEGMGSGVEKASGLGNSYTEGFSGGLLGEAFKGLWAKAAQIPATVNASVAAAQQSSSPSKLAMKRGEEYPQGYAIGFHNGIPSVVSEAKKLVDTVTDEFASPIPVGIETVGVPGALEALPVSSSYSGDGATYNLTINGDFVQGNSRIYEAMATVFDEALRLKNMQPQAVR
jgi:tape measure domain-containing protein